MPRIQAQNIQVAAGQIGEPPVGNNQQQQLTVLAPGELTSVDQFKNIVLRTDAAGGIVHLSDIARVELASQQYTTAATIDKYPAGAAGGVSGADGECAAGEYGSSGNVEEAFGEFAARGLEYDVAFNNSNFIVANVEDILRDAGDYAGAGCGGGVFVPAGLAGDRSFQPSAIPVSLIGVFAVLYILGYSANTIDLFAIVLAITLVVDDAIVVVENVTRNLEEHPDLSVVEATEKAMAEITGPVIATTLVLVAVFAPVGFVAGITGALYRQFATTISVSVVISAINALTLSPALCALMLKPPEKPRFRLFVWFNKGFDFARGKYGDAVLWLSRRLVVAGVVLGLAFICAYGVFKDYPVFVFTGRGSGLFPDERGDAEWRFAGTHQCGGGQFNQNPDGDAWVAHVVGISGVNSVSQAQEASYAAMVCYFEAVEPAEQQ